MHNEYLSAVASYQTIFDNKLFPGNIVVSEGKKFLIIGVGKGGFPLFREIGSNNRTSSSYDLVNKVIEKQATVEIVPRIRYCHRPVVGKKKIQKCGEQKWLVKIVLWIPESKLCPIHFLCLAGNGEEQEERIFNLREVEFPAK